MFDDHGRNGGRTDLKHLVLTQFEPKDAMRMYRAGIMEPLERGDLKNWADRNESDGPSYTLSYLGKPVGCFGVRIYWPHVGEAWVILSKDVKDYGAANPYGKRCFERLIDEYNLHRVGAFVRTDRPEFVRYAEYMGFEREGTCRKFMPDGTDCYMYARIR